jgi:adenosylcobyric acid synthase
MFEQSDAISLLTDWCHIETHQQDDFFTIQEQAINQLADTCEQYLDMDKVLNILKNWK